MFKKIIFLFFILLSANNTVGQETTSQEPFYINLFISADKNIYVETDKTDFKEVESRVANILRNTPFKLDQRIVYRIFADENLKLGYIMDVNQEMLSGYGDDVQTLRYLLNTRELNIDGQNWFKSIDMKKLKKMK
jgi:biopolymer transport protein ExbD